MSEIEPSELRIGDTEREDALRALGEHMSAGRLDIEEYGERSARITTAKTRGELQVLFTDLPAPRPAFGAPAPAPVPAAPPPRHVTGWEARPVGQRVFAALVPLSAIVGVILFLSVVHAWPILLLPLAVTAIGGALFGEEWQHERRNFDRRNRGYRRPHGRGWH
ncbi:DUF1707 domain-containing protein [Actinokineospora sp. NBRC 105648]|uniref:DUF1707 SHOCT-like domain-containing protein n=1 Tax=Actinokineospora sp. NBRC 105648 TaxID=3032206 RepID=UPI0024A16CF0|nr:DUF1707 domain-containing protein [Actinokineospora sp. NBRC 105648]GLZ38559.1 hypothetical protein Acsp05_21830 [Actinokineospora sp. NBRC 105648]